MKLKLNSILTEGTIPTHQELEKLNNLTKNKPDEDHTYTIWFKADVGTHTIGLLTYADVKKTVAKWPQAILKVTDRKGKEVVVEASIRTMRMSLDTYKAQCSKLLHDKETFRRDGDFNRLMIKCHEKGIPPEMFIKAWHEDWDHDPMYYNADKR